jgi:GMP synthase (glutamine-hydrolysing)
MTSQPTTTAALRICIVNGYPRASRENFDRSNVGHPHDLFRSFLQREAPNATSDIVYVADPDFSLPPGTTIADYDGFIWTGSDLTVYHVDDERVSGQIEFAKQLTEAGAASWGSCWGLQMAAQVGGGEVAVNPRGREWGIARSIELNDAARSSPMLEGKPEVFDGFIMHLDEVTRLPGGTPSLGGNTHTPIQAAIFDNGDASYWATQYHPEYNLYEMGRLIAARAEALTREGHFPDEESVTAYASDMMELHAHPDSQELRAALDIDDDIIDPHIREVELRNWLRFIEARSVKPAALSVD